jgi:hypothetical protein
MLELPSARSEVTVGRPDEAVPTPIQPGAPFGPPPLAGEDAAAYDHLLARITGAVKPRDFLEEIWVRDVLDLSWECLRWRRLKADVVDKEIASRLGMILEKSFDRDRAKELIAQWMRRDSSAIEQVNACLAARGEPLEAIRARVLQEQIRFFERVDVLTMQAENRRNSALREVELHRIGIASALRKASNSVIDGEFAEVPRKAIAGRDAA